MEDARMFMKDGTEWVVQFKEQPPPTRVDIKWAAENWWRIYPEQTLLAQWMVRASMTKWHILNPELRFSSGRDAWEKPVRMLCGHQMPVEEMELFGFRVERRDISFSDPVCRLCLHEDHHLRYSEMVVTQLQRYSRTLAGSPSMASIWNIAT